MILYFADYIQQVGSGTNEIVRQCKAQGLPEPEFVSVRNLEFKTILPRDVFTEVNLQQLGLNDRQLEAVKYIKQKNQITNAEYKAINRVSKATATRELARLVSLKVLKQHGAVGKGTFYKLS